jgi:plasmid stabilization system protein ParE
MARFRFTRRAEADLLDIAIYTLRAWGGDQTARYIGSLKVVARCLPAIRV